MTEQTVSGGLGPRLRGGARGLGRWIASAPVSMAIAALVLLVGVLQAVGVHVPGVDAVVPTRWRDLGLEALTSLLHTAHLGLALLAAAMLLLLGPLAERRLGSARTLLVGLAGHVVSVAVTVAVAVLMPSVDEVWAHQLTRQDVDGPGMWLLTAVMAVAVSWPTLWRRRVWTLVGTAAVAVPAFSGAPQDIANLVAIGVGVLLGGGLIFRSAARRGPVLGSRRELRVLVALAVGGVVVGTLAALGSPHLVGPLSGTRYLFAATSVTPEVWEQACSAETLTRACLRDTYILHANGLGPILLSAAPLAVQLVFVLGLLRGRRAAWIGTLVLQGMLAGLAAGHLALVTVARLNSGATPADVIAHRGPVPGPSVTQLILPVLVPLAVMALLLWHRRLFRVRTQAGTYRRLAVWVAGAAAAVVAVTVLVGLLLPDQFTPSATAGPLVVQALISVLPSPALTVLTPQLLPYGPVSYVLVGWLPLIPWAVLGWVALRSWRSLALGDAGRAEFREQVRAHAPASATLAWLGTWAGNTVWHDPAGRGAVAYRARRGVALTVGDPVCAEEDLPAVVAGFAEHCAAHALVPALYSVHPPTTALTRSLGWYTLQVAEETVLPLGEVKFAGKVFQDVRTARNRAAKEGIAGVWTTWEQAGPALREQVTEISEAWVADKALPEMGFTLGGLAELQDPEVRLLLAVDETGHVHGVTSWMPVFDGGEVVGLTLDFMRRRDGGFRPVMEFLIATAALDAQEEGLRLLSLSGAPLAHSDEESADADTVGPAPQAAEGTRVLTSGLDALGSLLEPAYGFRSLHAFKAKFKPTYVPMHLCLPDPADLPKVGLAVTAAYVPGMSLTDMVKVGGELTRRKD